MAKTVKNIMHCSNCERREERGRLYDWKREWCHCGGRLAPVLLIPKFSPDEIVPATADMAHYIDGSKWYFGDPTDRFYYVPSVVRYTYSSAAMATAKMLNSRDKVLAMTTPGQFTRLDKAFVLGRNYLQRFRWQWFARQFPRKDGMQGIDWESVPNEDEYWPCGYADRTLDLIMRTANAIDSVAWMIEVAVKEPERWAALLRNAERIAGENPGSATLYHAAHLDGYRQPNKRVLDDMLFIHQTLKGG